MFIWLSSLTHAQPLTHLTKPPFHFSSSCSLFRCNHQLFNPRAHVWLLWSGSLGTSDAEVPLVEEIPHHHSDGGSHCWAASMCVFCGVCLNKLLTRVSAAPPQTTASKNQNMSVQMSRRGEIRPGNRTNLLELMKALLTRYSLRSLKQLQEQKRSCWGTVVYLGSSFRSVNQTLLSTRSSRRILNYSRILAPLNVEEQGLYFEPLSDV